VAGNLVAAGFFDIAVRDVVLAIGAFTLARLLEVRAEDEARAPQPAAQATRPATA
jgi:purine-nucleoside phosphorylase